MTDSPSLPSLRETLQIFIDFFGRHPEVDRSQEILAQLKEIDSLLDGIPAEAVPPIARTISKILDASQSTIGRAWRAYQAITGPVFDRWRATGEQPPNTIAVSYKASPRAKLLGRSLQGILKRLDGKGDADLQVDSALRGIKMIDGLLTEELGHGFIGYTRGVTLDADIGRRKAYFLSLAWESPCRVSLEVLRDREAHGLVEVANGGAIVYRRDGSTVEAQLGLNDIRAYLHAGMAACEVVALDVAVSTARAHPIAARTRVP